MESCICGGFSGVFHSGIFATIPGKTAGEQSRLVLIFEKDGTLAFRLYAGAEPRGEG